jgi:hypothetical protein
VVVLLAGGGCEKAADLGCLDQLSKVQPGKTIWGGVAFVLSFQNKSYGFMSNAAN